MTMKWMAVLALALAPAAHGAAVKPVPAAERPAAGQVKVLRGEIMRDKADLTAKAKSGRAERAELAARMRAELAKVRETKGTRAEKASARKAVREKYGKLLREAREKSAFVRRNLNEDITSKSGLIKKLRQS